ncbi:hypothetical protein GCM10025865_22330 [Paraoerskovia sediminicola]|uniref:Aldose 1-epimerase n=1 Tax=Paraoerskovia sediminicola TaxID=1138587 RepID=A0ABM8G4F8_9CELL|nr:hypothetical protein GCM10025865_22330 [Paraoerskovia sediminicola]
MHVNTYAPSGTQFRITSGEHRAVVTEVGAAVREYSVGGRDVFVPFPEDQISPAYHGAVLVPWPNRLRDGRYEFDGGTHQVPVNEPERGTALHGLSTSMRWDLVDHAPDAVTLELRLPRPRGTRSR